MTLVVLVTLLSLVAGGLVVVRMRDQMSAEADARLDRHAEELADRVENIFTTASRDLRLARLNSSYDTALASETAQLTALNRTLVESSITYVGERYRVDEICLIRSSGLEAARWNGGEVATVADLSPDESENPFFKPAMALPVDSVYVTDPYVSPDSERWVYGFATPIVLETGARAGVLHFEIPIQRLTDLAASQPFGASGYAVVVDRAGRVLVHPNMDRLRAQTGGPTDPRIAPFPRASSFGSASWREIVGSALAGTSGGLTTFDDDGRQARIDYRPVGDTGLIVLMISPTSELYADVDRAHLNLIVTAGPLLMLMVLVSAWFARRLSSSNRRLAASMQASAELASIVASADDAILSVDRKGRIVTWNDGAERAFGLPRAAALGAPVIDLVAADRREEAAVHLAASELGETVDRFETVVQTTSGDRIDALLTFSPVRSDAGTVTGLSIIARDISSRKRLEEQLEHQALHDSLTGLPNRALFRDRLDHALARQTRPQNLGSTGSVAAVLFIDLDDFKVINDTLGHRIGDELLVEVGRRINAAIRPGDTAARLGGDEFTVLLEGLADATEAPLVADRVLRALAPAFHLEGHDVVISASIGIVASSEDHAGPDELLRSADTALYEAKAKGKGQHATFHSGMTEKAWQRLELESELRRAIADDQLIVEYQPIVDLRTGAIQEFEALVRWRHPDRGIIPPGHFIPLAEQTGLIVPIGEFVLTTAVRDLAGWRARRPEMAGVGLSVNLSPRELRRADLVDTIVRALGSAGLAPGDLRVEITEGIQLDDAASIERLRELRACGVRVSVDDFGTGYSSLSSFRTMPIDGLKLDRVFVGAIGDATEETAIVTAAIAFGAALQIDVTAEGIETPEQLDLLRELGCQRGQGFLMSRPIPASAIETLPLTLASHIRRRRHRTDAA
jgi:diguanylate cyclase (GGDEF)-like protein/PAS domain S-box-containing protein